SRSLTARPITAKARSDLPASNGEGRRRGQCTDRRARQLFRRTIAAAGGAPSVKKSHIDAPVLVTFLELDPVGFMEQVGIENDGPVGAVRHRDGLSARTLQKITHRGLEIG